ncbi:hypothetical protein SLS54_001161 [Diplodia seriata]
MLAARRIPAALPRPVRPRAAQFHASARAHVRVGDAVPDVELMEASPGNKLSIAKQLKGKGLIRFIADPAGAFTKALDLSFDSRAIFGNERSKRYALVIEDGKVKEAHVEPDNTGVDGTTLSSVLSVISANENVSLRGEQGLGLIYRINKCMTALFAICSVTVVNQSRRIKYD